MPACALDALAALNRRRQHPLDLPDPDLFAHLSAARSAAARLINAHADEIALAPNTSAGLNLAASFLARSTEQGGLRQRLDGRRLILFSDGEFPANVYPWLRLEREGFRAERIPTAPDGSPGEDDMLRRVAAGDVAALAVSSVQFSNGHRADLEALGAACHETGTFFIVDAIHSLGAVPVDVRASNIDILATGGQKWLCSPWGTGFTFVRRELATMLEPPQPGWLAFAATNDFSRLLEYDLELLPDARRFEIGSLAIQDFAAMVTSIELFVDLGVPAIHAHVLDVQAPLRTWARDRGVRISGSNDARTHSGIISLEVTDAERVFEELRRRQIICAVRAGAVRFSPHFYNTREEMDRVIEVLEEVLH